MRQEFIAPTFFPAISEGYLRADFNFAGYLEFALERVLSYIFQFIWNLPSDCGN